MQSASRQPPEKKPILKKCYVRQRENTRKQTTIFQFKHNECHRSVQRPCQRYNFNFIMHCKCVLQITITEMRQKENCNNKFNVSDYVNQTLGMHEFKLFFFSSCMPPIKKLIVSLIFNVTFIQNDNNVLYCWPERNDH